MLSKLILAAAAAALLATGQASAAEDEMTNHADIVFAGAYPPDSVKFVRSASENGLAPKMMGGTMIGLLATPLKVQLGPLMNGYVNNAEVFVPIPTFKFPGVEDVLAKYRERAKGQGVDPFG